MSYFIVHSNEDNTIRSSAGRIRNRYERMGRIVRYMTFRQFRALRQGARPRRHDKIIFVGHGSRLQFMGLSSLRFNQQIENILPRTFEGRIYLNGCETALRGGGARLLSFAERVTRGIRRTVNDGVSVKGNVESATTTAGVTFTQEGRELNSGKEMYVADRDDVYFDQGRHFHRRNHTITKRAF